MASVSNVCRKYEKLVKQINGVTVDPPEYMRGNLIEEKDYVREVTGQRGVRNLFHSYITSEQISKDCGLSWQDYGESKYDYIYPLVYNYFSTDDLYSSPNMKDMIDKSVFNHNANALTDYGDYHYMTYFTEYNGVPYMFYISSFFPTLTYQQGSETRKLSWINLQTKQSYRAYVTTINPDRSIKTSNYKCKGFGIVKNDEKYTLDFIAIRDITADSMHLTILPYACMANQIGSYDVYASEEREVQFSKNIQGTYIASVFINDTFSVLTTSHMYIIKLDGSVLYERKTHLNLPESYNRNVVYNAKLKCFYVECDTSGISTLDGTDVNLDIFFSGIKQIEVPETYQRFSSNRGFKLAYYGYNDFIRDNNGNSIVNYPYYSKVPFINVFYSDTHWPTLCWLGEYVSPGTTNRYGVWPVIYSGNTYSFNNTYTPAYMVFDDDFIIPATLWDKSANIEGRLCDAEDFPLS